MRRRAAYRYMGYVMGIRGYIIIKLEGTPDADRLWELTKLYESIDGVDFADTVTGMYDFVLTVDTKKTFEAVIHEVKELGTTANVLSLQINNLFDKHREIKDLKLLKDLSG